MNKPTNTINRIHFTDMENRRFEDLSMQLVYRLKNWISLHPDGRSGSDYGVDIRGQEKIDEEVTKDWFIQCKRYKKISSSGLKKTVDEIIKKNTNPPTVFLVVVGCDVSLKSRQDLENYSKENGISEPLLWQASTLETKLYSDHPDLLFAFFGISINKQDKNKEIKLKSSLVVKRKLNKILAGRKRGYNLIIHSIDDTTYPSGDETPEGEISPWFKVEFNDFYATGLELILNIEYIILEKTDIFWDAKWARFEPHSEGLKLKKYVDESGKEDYEYDFNPIIDKKKYDVYKTYRIGRISYNNIIEIDDIGDGIYPGLHIYCRFDIDRMPYEEFVNQLVDGVHLEMDNEIKFKNR
jgi:hypothetical protein